MPRTLMTHAKSAQACFGWPKLKGLTWDQCLNTRQGSCHEMILTFQSILKYIARKPHQAQISKKRWKTFGSVLRHGLEILFSQCISCHRIDAVDFMRHLRRYLSRSVTDDTWWVCVLVVSRSADMMMLVYNDSWTVSASGQDDFERGTRKSNWRWDRSCDCQRQTHNTEKDTHSVLGIAKHIMEFFFKWSIFSVTDLYYYQWVIVDTYRGHEIKHEFLEFSWSTLMKILFCSSCRRL